MFRNEAKNCSSNRLSSIYKLTKSKLVCQHLFTSGVQLVQQHAKAHSWSGNRVSVSEQRLNSVLKEMILYEGLYQRERASM